MCRRKIPEEVGDRKCPDPEHEYGTNTVITSKYTLLNFVPKFLFEQFSRLANFYFLIICCLQAIPPISITNGLPTALVPLGFVLFFDAVVTAREDYKRHKDDDKANNATTYRFIDGAFQKAPWKDVKVGDIIRIPGGAQDARESEVPADCIFLSAPRESESCNKCYVMTAQLDGETNLKLKKAPPKASTTFTGDDAVKRFRGFVECEPPKKDFNSFRGSLHLEFEGKSDVVQQPLTAEQALWRGCVVRNVQYVYALVIYTGQDTKVRVGQRSVSTKKASVEKSINTNIILLASMLLLMCTIGASGSLIWSDEFENKADYLLLEGGSGGAFFKRLFTFVLLNSLIIPISLYVTMKLARQMQKFFMEQDRQCAYKHPDTGDVFPLKVRSMDLNDELGQMTHVFSDKTGTLTSNYMVFRKLLVNGVSYGRGTTEIGISRRQRLKKQHQLTRAAEEHFGATLRLMEKKNRAVKKNKSKDQPHVNWIDGSDNFPGRSLAKDFAHLDSEQGRHIYYMLLNMALDHSVEYEQAFDDDGNPVGAPRLSASSPEEEAFVYAARQFGVSFASRDLDEVGIELHSGGTVPLKFTIVETLPYSSKRKMMSVLTKDEENRYILYAKGAGSKIFSKLSSLNPQELLDSTESIVEEWSEDAFRCLVFAYRMVPAEEAEDWVSRLLAARSDIKQVKAYEEGEKGNLIDTLMDEMESELLLQGATALEDKLQEGVPDTIEKLREARVKVFMLTGDKQQTAEEIGHATRMLGGIPPSNIFRITEDAVKTYLQQHPEAGTKRTKDSGKDKASINSLIRKWVKEASDTVSSKSDSLPYGVIIDEATLDQVIPHDKPAKDDLVKAFLTLLEHCPAVICCRFRPDQKASVVEVVRKYNKTAKTLAIGDGANDVPMIQSAHVGVGITGAEGVQAANASDFSIARFKFLQRLLLVHGRWNYNRISKLVLYMFYKNIAYALAQYLYSIWTGWSGQKFYIEVAHSVFNLAFTGLPVLLMGIFDQDVSADSALRFPLVYRDGPLHRRFNVPIFWTFVLSGLLDGTLLYFVPYFSFQVPGPGGDTPYSFQFGTLVFSAVIAVVNFRIAIETSLHDWRYQLFIALSSLVWIPGAFILDALDSNGMRGGIADVFGSSNFWFVIVLLCVLCVGYVGSIKVYNKLYRPTFVDLVQELQVVVPANQETSVEPTRRVEMTAKEAIARELKAWSKHPADGRGRKQARMDPTSLDPEGYDDTTALEVKEAPETASSRMKRHSSTASRVSDVSYEHPGMEGELSMADPDGRMLETLQSRVGLLSGGQSLLSPSARARFHREESPPPPPPPPDNETRQTMRPQSGSFFEVVNPVRNAMRANSSGTQGGEAQSKAQIRL